MEKINWKQLGIVVLMVAVVPFFLYMNTFWMALVFNDNLSLTTAIGSGTPPSILDAIYRPLTQPWVRASFITDMAHYQSNFGWYHFVNSWLHLSSAVALSLLVFALLRLTKNERIRQQPVYEYALPALAGLVFACHPLAAQTATYISARSASLGAANFLLALLFFCFIPFSRGAIKVWAILLTILFSMMCFSSDEVALALAPSMVALYFLFKPASKKWNDWALDRPILSGVTFLISLLAPFYLFMGFSPAGAANTFGFPTFSPVAYYATGAKALLTYYTRVFVVPFGLSLDPPFSQADNFADPFAIGGLLLLGAAFYGLYVFRHRPIPFFGVWLTLAGFLPHALIVQQDAVSDSAFYLPLAGLSLLLSWFLLELFNSTIKAEAPKLVAILLVLCGLSVMRNLEFANEHALVSATLRTNQNSQLGLAHSSMEHLKQAKYDEAIKEADQGLASEPENAVLLWTKGQAQMKLDHSVEAKDTLEKAANVASEKKLPIEGAIKYVLAEAWLRAGNVNKANEVLTQAFTLEPNNPRAMYMLGMMSLKRKNYKESLVYMQRAMQQGVDDAPLPLIRSLVGVKGYKEAQAMAQVVVDKQNSAEAQLLLGAAALGNRDVATAETALRSALKSRPQDAEAMALLSIVYQRKGDKVLADSYHMDAIKRDPNVFKGLIATDPLPSPDALDAELDAAAKADKPTKSQHTPDKSDQPEKSDKAKKK